MHPFIEEFESQLEPGMLFELKELRTPFRIQEFLDGMPYLAEERDRSPINVLRDKQCHCLDGGLFAALALWRIGHLPLMIDLVPDPGVDDDHVLALFKIDGHWGAIAKSNYVNLGYREPVHKNLRELVMTYFEHYCSVNQTKTLRGYTRPFDLTKYCQLSWALNEVDTNKLFYQHFYKRKPTQLISQELARQLNPITDRVYKAETLFTDLSWSFGIRPGH